tara:strand:+ start:1898 stop:2695 length:798 start_codon:yes stop_codon:yes gene_type:complete
MNILHNFNEKGYYSPLNAFSGDKAAYYKERLFKLKKKTTNIILGNNAQINLPHLLFTFVDEIIRNKKILDSIEIILGPNLLVHGSSFFIKKPNSKTFISWHQDLRYWGLNKDREVTAWVALTKASIENGCMSFIPGSHKKGMQKHKDTYEKNNFLTRGQEVNIKNIEHEQIYAPLLPGQFSLHHGKILHSSAPNNTDKYRIGLSINYIATDMKQLEMDKDYATLVRGEDNFNNFELVPPPICDLSSESIELHQKILHEQNKVFYK